MKSSKAIFVIMFMSSVALSFSQSYTDFIVVDEIADNYAQLETEFRGQPNVYWTDGSSLNTIAQISNASGALQIENLHIYVPTKPGAIVFSSIAITTTNIDEMEADLKVWSKVVTGNVVIHSEVVFTGDDGTLLKQRLEEITGLVFTTQN